MESVHVWSHGDREVCCSLVMLIQIQGGYVRLRTWHHGVDPVRVHQPHQVDPMRNTWGVDCYVTAPDFKKVLDILDNEVGRRGLTADWATVSLTFDDNADVATVPLMKRCCWGAYSACMRTELAKGHGDKTSHLFFHHGPDSEGAHLEDVHGLTAEGGLWQLLDRAFVCPVCMEEGANGTVFFSSCSHFVCRRCLGAMAAMAIVDERTLACPMCRTLVVKHSRFYGAEPLKRAIREIKW